MSLHGLLTSSWINLKKEVIPNSAFYILLSTVLALAFFVRVYRLSDLLGFYYDQGRDALVIWKFWHENDPFLIGPVTGLHGIFLGPLYYYLIAPFYLIGQGDPVYPAVFLALTSVLALAILYVLGFKMHSRAAGVIAVIIGGFSYYLVLAGRWLSNPTPIMLTSVLLLMAMWNIVSNDKSPKTKDPGFNFYWLAISFLVGISLQFESASAIFYIPMIIVFAIWQRKKTPDKKTLVISVLIFLATLLPQVVFDLKHNGIISDNLRRELLEEKSFRNPLLAENLQVKKEFLMEVFTSKIFPGIVKHHKLYYFGAFIGLFLLTIRQKNVAILFLIFLGIPSLGYVFFQGNSGNMYDYYTTGYYLPLILLFSLGLSNIWTNFLGKIFVGFFIVAFLSLNLSLVKNYLTSPFGGHIGIALGTEVKAVDWVYSNSDSREFNVDVYVPPVIPHSYDYLFLWRGAKLCRESFCGLTQGGNAQLLYTLYEEDPPHPERLSSWLLRQSNIGTIQEHERFGNVTVQRRERI